MAGGRFSKMEARLPVPADPGRFTNSLVLLQMDNAERKALIRKRLNAARYLRRRHAIFDDANDHNPMVLQDCHACGGTGRRCKHLDESTIARIECPECDGRGITGDVEPYFDELPEPTRGKPNSGGWLKCPRCLSMINFSEIANQGCLSLCEDVNTSPVFAHSGFFV